MKKYFSIVLIAIIILSSCEEDKLIFNGSQTLVAFSSTSIDLPIEIDATGSVNIAVDVSTVSTSERTFDVSIVEEETTASAASYSLGSIMVPANSYNGVLTINGVDNNVDTTPERLVLKIAEGSDFITSAVNLTVRIFQVCPIDETLFTGLYLIEQTTPFLAGPSLATGTVIEVTADGLLRSFNTPNFPNFCSALNDFTFNLVCNEIVVPFQDNNCNCGDGEDYFGPATIANGVYDINDDSEFTVIFSDDTKENCGSTGQTSYRFTKQ